MVNDIKGPNPTVVSNLTGQQQADQARNNTNAAGNRTPESSGDSVSLTDQAETLRALENSIEKQPVVDTKRVESIRNAILDGSYVVDANKTAEKMADFEQLLDSKIGDQ